MEDRLQILEQETRKLEPDATSRQKLWDTLLNHTESFLEKLESGNAFHDSYDPTIDHSVYESPNEAHSLHSLIDKVNNSLDETGINPASGNHLGYIPGGGLYASALGDFWADITNRYAGVYFANPGAVKMENSLVKWMCDMVGYPESALGNLSSGGSIANLSAIVVAREAHGIQSENVKSSAVYLSEQVHHCVYKALRIAGMAEVIVRKLPVDVQYRIIPEALEEQINRDKSAGLTPWMVVASAGTTDVGAIDPLDDLASIAKRNDAWLHVDAAYGAFFMLVDSLKEKFNGIEKSDSVVMDPHKGLFLPYGSGVVLVKNGELMKKAFTYDANYMQDAISEEHVSPADISPELTKHFRGLRLWLPLQLHGIKPFKAALEEKYLLAQYFYQKVQEIPGIEVLMEPELSVVTYRYVPEKGNANQFNQTLIKEILNDGRIFISSTTLDGKFVLRVAILVFRTHKNTIDLYLQILKEKIGQINSNWK